MSKHNVEMIAAKFVFKVNNDKVEVHYNEHSKTILLFHGVTVYTSQKETLRVKDAETIVWQYLETLNIIAKKNG